MEPHTWKDTHDVVVLAADRGSLALALAHTDNGDGRAIEANKRVGLDSYVKEVEESGDDPSTICLCTHEKNRVCQSPVFDLLVELGCSTELGRCCS